MGQSDLLRAWYRLMANAVRDTTHLQQAMQDADVQGHPAEWFARWMRENDLPGAPADPDDPSDDWMEQWYRTMGVVPRSRYLRLLERHEKLRNKLEAAKRRIERLRDRTDAAPEEAANEALRFWQNALNDTLEAQSKWMESMHAPAESDADDASDDTPSASSDDADPNPPAASDAS